MHLLLLMCLLSCGRDAETGNRPGGDGNHLADATSPYLVRHADDPVDWWPWGDEAFARARAEDKPVLLSIGYATCHWCHVMERESFEDEAIAAFIDAHFVAIKVDREERPDVDEHYMAAVQALTGRSGWPATLVLTPTGEPIFAASYLPAHDGDRPGLRGLREVLGELAEAWGSDRNRLEADAHATSERLTRPPPPSGDLPGPQALHAAAAGLLATWDREHGGFGRSPKFPRPTVISFLLRYHRRTGDPAARDAALQALRAMAASPLYDAIGGGFHRYTTDRSWQRPHFEKLLVDQALLVMAYLDGYQVSGDPELARVARDTVDFVIRELSDPENGFHSALDADTVVAGELVEGGYYTWSADEVRAVAGDDALAWLAVPVERGPVSARPGAPEAGRRALYQARRGRAAPAVDDKVIAGWTGLMISALARAALVLDEPLYIQRASTAAEFVVRRMRAPDGTLQRSWRGKPSQSALLEDHTFLVQGLLDLYEASADLRWLDYAATLQQRCDRRFAAPDGAWYRSAVPDPRVPRTIPRLDGAEPSGAGVGVLNELRLAELLGDVPWGERARDALRVLSGTANAEGHAATVLMAAVDFELDRPAQVVVLGARDDAVFIALVDVVRRAWLPNRVLLVTDDEGARLQERLVPLLEGKQMLGGPTAFVCERGLCEAPTSDPQVLKAQLSRVDLLPPP